MLYSSKKEEGRRAEKEGKEKEENMPEMSSLHEKNYSCL